MREVASSMLAEYSLGWCGVNEGGCSGGCKNDDEGASPPAQKNSACKPASIRQVWVRGSAPKVMWLRHRPRPREFYIVLLQPLLSHKSVDEGDLSN